MSNTETQDNQVSTQPVELNLSNYCLMTVCGRLSQDPIIQTFPKGGSAIKFSVACNLYKNQDRHTIYQDISVENSFLIDTIQNLKKGSPVVVRGKIGFFRTTNKKTNEPMVKLCIKADQIDILNKHDLTKNDTKNDSSTPVTQVVRVNTESDDGGYPFNLSV